MGVGGVDDLDDLSGARPDHREAMLDSVGPYSPLAIASRARARREPPIVFINPAGPPIAEGDVSSYKPSSRKWSCVKVTLGILWCGSAISTWRAVRMEDAGMPSFRRNAVRGSKPLALPR